MQTIDLGENWPLYSYWYDANRQPAEPTAITLTVTSPTGVVTTKTKVDLVEPTPTPTAHDVWFWPQLINANGAWRYEYVGTVDGNEVRQASIFLAGPSSKPPGPCEPWATWLDVQSLCPEVTQLVNVPTATREYLLDVATWVLYQLDGRRYPGICSTTRYICRSCWTCGGICGCGIRDSIDLGGGRYPVHGVFEVVVDGLTLDPSTYRLRAKRWLDRIDDSWPAGSLADPDSFRVTYAYGRVPSIGLRHGAAVYASEMAKRCVGVKCRIPERVTTFTREGTTYTIIDAQRFLDEGRTGITEVDSMLHAAREGKFARPGGYSPMHSRG